MWFILTKVKSIRAKFITVLQCHVAFTYLYMITPCLFCYLEMDRSILVVKRKQKVWKKRHSTENFETLVLFACRRIFIL